MTRRAGLNAACAALLVAAAASPSRAAKGDPLGSYDFYPTSVEGSARYVGLAGSIVASPNDYSASFINPAGLGGLAGDGVDFGSDSNNIDNYVVDVSNPKARALSDPIKFSFSGFRFVSENGWGFGFATQTPYEFDDVFSGTTKLASKGQCFNPVLKRFVPCTSLSSGQDQTEIKATNKIYTLAVGKSFLDKRLSFGLAANYIQVSEQYNFAPALPSTPTVALSATNDTFSADFGVLGKPWPWLKLGAVYKMGYRVAFDPTRNADARGTNGLVAAFRDGKAPDRVSLGLAWEPNRYFRLFAQSNYVLGMRDTVVVGSGLFPGVASTLTVGHSDTVDGHWGAEVVPIDETDLTIKFWAGGYLEDTGLQGGYRRYHRTAGFGFSPWFLGLSMAIDDTENYNNFTVGLGVDMLEVASRVAKTYGWKLPL